ncbi:MAG: hypothetical protein GM44_3110 [actinobacterium acAMD-2]|nr:MAG: hypothetical protein GM44_3110 [actinobacterium acAMD-2]HAS08558.1 hypothetical protein [Actinomycetota bacterium]
MICLQGGTEFGADCFAMDAALVQEAHRRGRTGPIVISALAGAPGREYDTANNNGIRHFSAIVESLTSDHEPLSVIAAPDARADSAGALAALESASIIVLPGGSPSRLLGALQDFAIDALLRRFLDSGGILMGASAGAMVLCERTWLPDRGRIADGLGLVPHALVLPHWSPDGLSRLASFGGAGTGINVLGLPEQSGVMVENTDSGTTFTAHGARGSTIVEANGPTHAVRVGDCLTLPARIGP